MEVTGIRAGRYYEELRRLVVFKLASRNLGDLRSDVGVGVLGGGGDKW